MGESKETKQEIPAEISRDAATEQKRLRDLERQQLAQERVAA